LRAHNSGGLKYFISIISYLTVSGSPVFSSKSYNMDGKIEANGISVNYAKFVMVAGSTLPFAFIVGQV
jgi:hypothetical protein